MYNIVIVALLINLDIKTDFGNCNTQGISLIFSPLPGP